MDTLQIKGNAVTVPTTSVGGTFAGTGSLLTLTSVTMDLEVVGDVVLWWSIEQDYSGGGGWKLQITRTQVSTGAVTVMLQRTGDWMGATNDYPSGSCMADDIPAGDFVYRLRWAANTSNLLAKGTLVVMGAKR